MDRNDFILGGIALVVGVLIGLLFAPRGPDMTEIEAALDERLATVEGAASGAGESVAALQTQMQETVSSLQTQIGELGERLGTVETTVGEVRTTVGELQTTVGENAEAQATMAEELRAEVAGVSDTVGSAIASQTETLQSRLATLDEAQERSPAAAAEGEGQPAAEQAQPAAQDPDFLGMGAGQTAVFGDGALRAFVSRVDAGQQTARVAVNGEVTDMDVGETLGLTTVDGTFCQLMLSGVQNNQVALNAQCGEDLPDPEGVRPGNVMLLAEGAVRVFVSGITDGGNSARIAINGVETRAVAAGESVDVTVEDQACQVTVDAIDRGYVALSTTCGA